MRTAITQARRSGAFVGLKDLVRPQQLPSLAAWYDISDTSSLIYDASNRVALVGDKSGNSSTNVLCLNGVAGNYASAPDSVPLSITGDIDIRAYLALDDWTPSAAHTIIGKIPTTSGQWSYTFDVNTTTGTLLLGWSPNGSSAAVIAKSSTVAPTVANYAGLWIRATLDVDNGAAGNTVTFYTSTDGVAWTQLGDPVVTAGVTSIFNGTADVGIGSNSSGVNRVAGLIYRAQIYNGIAGTLVFDANFATASKLAPSFTESSSNAATVTINTSGATGARISGARDLYQGTVANQPILTIAAAGNYLTFDGSNDYLKSPAFALPQPISRYTVGSQVSWTSGDYLWDGASAANSAALIQTTSTPRLNLNAGSSVAANTGLVLQTLSVISEIFNGAASFLTIARQAATTGNAGAGAPNGVTIGASGAATAANFGNITISEHLVYAASHGTNFSLRILMWLWRKWKPAFNI